MDARGCSSALPKSWKNSPDRKFPSARVRRRARDLLRYPGRGRSSALRTFPPVCANGSSAALPLSSDCLRDECGEPTSRGVNPRPCMHSQSIFGRHPRRALDFRGCNQHRRVAVFVSPQALIWRRRYDGGEQYQLPACASFYACNVSLLQRCPRLGAVQMIVEADLDGIDLDIVVVAELIADRRRWIGNQRRLVSPTPYRSRSADTRPSGSGSA